MPGIRTWRWACPTAGLDTVTIRYDLKAIYLIREAIQQTAPMPDKRDRGRHRGWAWIDLGGEPDDVPSIRTTFK